MKKVQTYKNVPPLNNNSTPVHHLIDSSPAPSAIPPPNVLTTIHVAIAPPGAARLKNTKCTLAARLPSPCFNNTDVSPNAAGALCTMMARKMIKDSDLVVVDEEDAPSAMPSAAAWMQRPRVVENERGGGDVLPVGEEAVERSDRE